MAEALYYAPMPPTLQEGLVRASYYPGEGLLFVNREEQRSLVTWAQVLEGAMRVCGGLQALGLEPGQRVALIYPTCPEFFYAFFGVLLAGGVPSPLYPPVRLGRMSEYHARTAKMLRLASAQLLLTETQIRRILGETVRLANPRLGCFTLDELPQEARPPVTRQSEDLGFVQFSSGTTADPKPVALSHRACLAQTQLIISEILAKFDGHHAGVSWLPLYHDMGLIGCVFPALVTASTLSLIGPEHFVTRPGVWLRELSRAKATLTTAPNFAYSLCTQRITDAELEGVDLSHWKLALNGAEPVAPSVLRAFQDRFARWGLAPEALTPVYGLAEAALAVTFSDLGRPFTTERFDRHTLALGQAVLDPEGVELVSVGRPVLGFQVEIRDEQRQLLPEGLVGRVWARGPSLMSGYLDQPEATAEVLVDGWLNTGDLGFFWKGELFLTGRAKDVVVLRGRKYAPQALEQPLDGVPGVRVGCSAAVSFMPEGGDTERVMLFVEHMKDCRPEELKALPSACAAVVLASTGIAADEVIPLPAGTLPRTSSGKIRRAEALRLYLLGELLPPNDVTTFSLLKEVGRSMLHYGAWSMKRRG